MIYSNARCTDLPLDCRASTGANSFHHTVAYSNSRIQCVTTICRTEVQTVHVMFLSFCVIFNSVISFMVCRNFTEEWMFDFILCNTSWNLNLSYVKHLFFSKFSKQMTMISPHKINCMNELCYVISITYLKKKSCSNKCYMTLLGNLYEWV